MACTCKSFDGSPLERCMGICHATQGYKEQIAISRAYQGDEVQKTVSDGFAVIESRLREITTVINREYQRGFKDGFEMGVECGRE